MPPRHNANFQPGSKVGIKVRLDCNSKMELTLCLLVGTVQYICGYRKFTMFVIKDGIVVSNVIMIIYGYQKNWCL